MEAVARPREFLSQHVIEYRVAERVPIWAVADSLVAFEKVVRGATPAVQAFFPGIRIAALNVYVDRLETGSLKDTFLFRFCFKDDESYNRFIQRAREITGVEQMQDRFPFLGRLVTGALILGAGIYLGRIPGCDQRPADDALINLANARIEGDVIIGGDALLDTLRREVKNKAQMASNAAKVIRPAKADPAGCIIVDGQDQLTIGAPVVAAIPELSAHELPDEEWESRTNELLQVRAMDFDSSVRGWRAIVPAISERRLPMTIDPSIDRELLRGGTAVHADLRVKWKAQPDGESRPVAVELLRLQ